ncbi:hypothetical protein GCM10023088_17800 [Actinomadura verrucosospora]
MTAVTAVCMGLLLSEASLTGGAPHDLLAARTWRAVKERVAGAQTDIAADLLIPPRLAHAHVLGSSGWERLLDLAHSDDPVALIAAEFAEEELTLESDHGIHRVTGRFSNPVPVAARVTTLLGRHPRSQPRCWSSRLPGRPAARSWRSRPAARPANQRRALGSFSSFVAKVWRTR